MRCPQNEQADGGYHEVERHEAQQGAQHEQSRATWELGARAAAADQIEALG